MLTDILLTVVLLVVLIVWIRVEEKSCPNADTVRDEAHKREKALLETIYSLRRELQASKKNESLLRSRYSGDDHVEAHHTTQH